MNEVIRKLIDEYFKPNYLKKKLFRSIEEAEKEFSKKGLSLTDDLIIEGLDTFIEVAENEAIHRKDITNLAFYLEQALNNDVFKKHVLLYSRLKKKSHISSESK